MELLPIRLYNSISSFLFSLPASLTLQLPSYQFHLRWFLEPSSNIVLRVNQGSRTEPKKNFPLTPTLTLRDLLRITMANQCPGHVFAIVQATNGNILTWRCSDCTSGPFVAIWRCKISVTLVAIGSGILRFRSLKRSCCSKIPA
ncbi:hypothetical protein AFLA_003220 [Aspergillus flavus NRRL3357]|nr:hypothetical protein AFLA_003220 [Aspergillus flavus NRRL3357]